MSDETNGHNGETTDVVQETPKQPPTPTLVIRLKGPQIEVEGPLENKILCYGMLKMAEQAIEGWRPDPGVMQIKAPVPLRGRFGPIS